MPSKPSLDAGVPFPPQPTAFPDCQAAYAPRADRDATPMCYVRGGSYVVPGIGENHPADVHADLGDFLIDQHEVTVDQFVRFMNDGYHVDHCIDPTDLCRRGGTSPAPPVIYRDGRFEALPGKASLAMWSIDPDLAKAYCAWAGKRLPTTAEWDVAAHDGPTGKRTKYTWGDEWEAGRTHCDKPTCLWLKEPAAPGAFRDLSAWGAMDMQGNIGEWVIGCDGGSCDPLTAGDEAASAFNPGIVDGLRCVVGGSIRDHAG